MRRVLYFYGWQQEEILKNVLVEYTNIKFSFLKLNYIRYLIIPQFASDTAKHMQLTSVFAFKESKLIFIFMQEWNKDSYQIQNRYATQWLLHAAIVSLINCNSSRFWLLAFNFFFIAIPLNTKLQKYIADILQLLHIMKSMQFICPNWSLSFIIPPVGRRPICYCSVCPVHRSIISLSELKEEQNITCLLYTHMYCKTLWYTAQSILWFVCLEQVNKKSKIIMVTILQVLEGIWWTTSSL